ncbi:MAG: tripartite tricarboxylate transporter substrate binding protein [Xanthobacteraceae bacterium]|nr:tripartite tricarboxylate transporter substrate binding protein [Xanthobacteraceae bacterium]
MIARLLADHFRATIGGAYVVENVTGAGGNLGTDRAAKAAPDGHTLVLSSSGPLANNSLLYKNMPYDPQKDLTPISLVAEFPMVLAARTTLGTATIKDFVALAKTKRDALNVGNPGVGTMGHLTAELFQNLADIKLLHIPSRGGYANSIAALLAGDLDLMSDVMNGNIIAMIRSGKIAGLAVTTRGRFPGLPDTPTAIEQGVALEASTAFALAGPAGMPRPVVEKLNSEVNRFLASDEGKARLSSLGARVMGGAPSAVTDMMVASIKQWKPIVDAAKISF